MNNISSYNAQEFRNTSQDAKDNLLFSLLNIIASSTPENSLMACDNLLILLKNLSSMFESFDPNPKILMQLNLERLFEQSDDSLSLEPVFGLLLFILRYYTGITYKSFGLSAQNNELLKDFEMKRLWKTLDTLVLRLEALDHNSKSRNVRISINN